MSVLKGILHRWNKTTRNYDIIHPETESARVTDWHQGIVNTLASTALSGLVNTLTSDSLLATMIKKVLTATGVKYSMGQNGYICFGSLFGGLIIQWIRLEVHQGNHYQSFPIAFKYGAFAILTNTNDSDANNIYRISAGGATNSGFYYSFTFDDKKDCFAVCFGI